MSFTTTYSYVADVIDKKGNSARREGEVTVGGAEGHAGARAVVRSKVRAEGYTLTHVELRKR